MNPSAVEKITPHPNEPREAAWRPLPPAIAFLLRWDFFALIAIVIVLSLVLGLVQKWLACAIGRSAGASVESDVESGQGSTCGGSKSNRCAQAVAG